MSTALFATVVVSVVDVTARTDAAAVLARSTCFPVFGRLSATVLSSALAPVTVSNEGAVDIVIIVDSVLDVVGGSGVVVVVVFIAVVVVTLVTALGNVTPTTNASAGAVAAAAVALSVGAINVAATTTTHERRWSFAVNVREATA